MAKQKKQAVATFNFGANRKPRKKRVNPKRTHKGQVYGS